MAKPLILVTNDSCNGTPSYCVKLAHLTAYDAMQQLTLGN